MPRSSRWRAWTCVGLGAEVCASLVLSLARCFPCLPVACPGGDQEHLAAPRVMTPRRLGAVVLLYAAVGPEGSIGPACRRHAGAATTACDISRLALTMSGMSEALHDRPPARDILPVRDAERPRL